MLVNCWTVVIVHKWMVLMLEINTDSQMDYAGVGATEHDLRIFVKAICDPPPRDESLCTSAHSEQTVKIGAGGVGCRFWDFSCCRLFNHLSTPFRWNFAKIHFQKYYK